MTTEIGRTDGRCYCGRFLATGGECARCEHYRCTGCARVVPWDFGAADALFLLCDDCAVAELAAREVLREEAYT